MHRFCQTPAVASVWTDALDSFVFAAFFPKPGRPLLETLLGARSGKVVFRFSWKIARPAKNLERPPNFGGATGSNPAPERDQEKWSSGFPEKSRDQQRIWSGHRTLEGPPEAIPLQSAIGKSGHRYSYKIARASKESRSGHRTAVLPPDAIPLWPPRAAFGRPDYRQSAIVTAKHVGISIIFAFIVAQPSLAHREQT